MNQTLNNIARELQIDMDTIATITAEYFYISTEKLLSRCRDIPVVVYRETAFYICYLAGFSTVEIGKKFNYNNSTIHNAVDNINFWVKKYDDVYQNVNNLKIKILEKFLEIRGAL